MLRTIRKPARKSVKGRAQPAAKRIRKTDVFSMYETRTIAAVSAHLIGFVFCTAHSNVD